MGRLVIVANRLPISVVKKEGELYFEPSMGGLATGIKSFYQAYNGIWIGWPGISQEKIKGEENNIEARLISEGCYPVFLSQNDIENYYQGFCNKIVWPLFHYFTQYVRYNKIAWKAYKQVNEVFCKAVMKVVQPDDIVWVHDFHLMLLPALIRERLPEVTLGFFLHIPFPSSEVFRLLPWRKEILEGLLGADLIGFHTYDYVRHFIESVRRLLGYDYNFSQIIARNRITGVEEFPMGIDYDRYANAVFEPEVQKEVKRIRKRVGERRIIISIDRLDYTKGISQRLETFDLFLEKYPEYKEKVTLILVAVPSRVRVEQYRLLKKQVDELVGRVDGKYGTIGWMPLWYLYRFLQFHRLVALYNVADVALITPLRDGMNLIAKEFIATKSDGKGVLILSEMAGAAKELRESIIVNQNNSEEVVEALKEALTMPEEKQISCNRLMQKRLQRYNIVRWASEFMASLKNAKKASQELCGGILNEEIESKLINDYHNSNKRLILLNFDGTLVPFSGSPEETRFDDRILKKSLRTLAQEPKNEVVIISGRDKDSLEGYFAKLKVGLAAEHGVWIREKGERSFEMAESLRNDWKEEIRSLLEFFVDRTPGAFVEEKDSSLVWHYRKADFELGPARASELKDTLFNLVSGLNLVVLEGNKIIEVKNVNINKGRAASHWIEKKNWDFILSIGDDVTDEDIFVILPESSYTIKVGFSHSHAKFHLDSVNDVKSLLKKLAG